MVFIFSGFGFVHGTIASRLREALSCSITPRVTAPPPAVPTRHSSGRAKAARRLVLRYAPQRNLGRLGKIRSPNWRQDVELSPANRRSRR